MRVAVVGAGIAGLAAARCLATRNEVVVFDKAGHAGGRFTSVRLGGAVLDQGAQFFTVRGATFRQQVEEWIDQGVARVWCHGFSEPFDGHPRHVGTEGMSGLASELASGLDIRLHTMVFSLRRPDRAAGWQVVIDDGSIHDADALVLTCPLPQSWALLAQAGLDLPDDLLRTPYHRTVSWLAVLDRPANLPEPGAVQFDPDDPGGTFAFVADQQAKGISSVPAVVAHASNPWSLDRWDVPDDEIAATLADAAGPWLGDATVVDQRVKRWRFATPARTWPDPLWSDDAARVVLGGDALAGPRVEGAFDSGLAAAARIESFR